MSFCQDVKKELCKLEEKKEQCEKARLYGMLSFSRSFPEEAQVFATENKFVAEHFAQSLAGMMGTFVTIHSDPRRLKENVPMYAVLIEDPHQREFLCEYFSISSTVFMNCSARITKEGLTLFSLAIRSVVFSTDGKLSI